MKRKIIIIISIIIALIVSILLTIDNNKETIKYNNKSYTLLEYKPDIFMYNYYSNNYYEVDKIYEISHDKWKTIYLSGDLYIENSKVKQATKYYANDKNYKWYIGIEQDDNYKKIPITLSKKELNYLYNIEDIKKEQTIKFEDIKLFVDLIKESNDSTVQGITTCVYYKDSIYWKTEIMTESDEEYIIKLPDTLTKQILDKVL